MTVAAEIKALARKCGVPQRLLAERSRMSRASVSLKLNGHRDMTLSELERLAAVLGTTPKALIVRAERTGPLAAVGNSSDRFTIQDKASGAVILQSRLVDGDGGDEA